MIQIIKIAEFQDLNDILTLYKELFPEENYTDSKLFLKTWSEIINDKKIKCFIAYCGLIPVSSCTITIIPNLSRNQKSYAFLENVITHKDYRKKGFGKSVMEKAIQYAKEKDCYKIMLLSSINRKDAHKFYEKIGFNGDSKKGFQLRLQ